MRFSLLLMSLFFLLMSKYLLQIKYFPNHHTTLFLFCLKVYFVQGWFYFFFSPFCWLCMQIIGLLINVCYKKNNLRVTKIIPVYYNQIAPVFTCQFGPSFTSWQLEFSEVAGTTLHPGDFCPRSAQSEPSLRIYLSFSCVCRYSTHQAWTFENSCWAEEILQ